MESQKAGRTGADFKRTLSVFEKELDSAIGKVEGKGCETLYDGAAYAMTSGGKRLRPVVFLMACKALGLELEPVMPVAVAIETAHNFTLVHDDIEDGDETRRGLPTVWKKYGVPEAINIGDQMLLSSLGGILKAKLSDKTKMELWKRFSETLTEIVEGQAMEFSFRTRDDVDEDEYVRMATKKAGVFFGFCLEAAAIVGGRPQKTRQALYELGSYLGLAFMIMDDVLNVCGDARKYGKEIGGDIKEGKRTLMTIHFLRNAPTDESSRLLRMLRAGRDNVKAEDVSWAIEALKDSGSVAYARGFAERLVKDSMKRLKDVENDELKDAVRGLAGLLVDRES